jgi:exonuclease SbcD
MDMRVLHTADLHLGRQFNGIPLDDDHAAVLDQVLRAVVDLRADVLVIAGDIFDRAAPPETAVRQFNAFLARFASETEAAFVMIAGNHDSGHRIAAMSIMPDTRRVLIRGAVSPDEKPLLLSDEHGTVAFSGLPFAYEYAARECFADEKMQTPEDVLRAQVAAARLCQAHAGATASDRSPELEASIRFRRRSSPTRITSHSVTRIVPTRSAIRL